MDHTKAQRDAYNRELWKAFQKVVAESPQQNMMADSMRLAHQTVADGARSDAEKAAFTVKHTMVAAAKLVEGRYPSDEIEMHIVFAGASRDEASGIMFAARKQRDEVIAELSKHGGPGTAHESSAHESSARVAAKLAESAARRSARTTPGDETEELHEEVTAFWDHSTEKARAFSDLERAYFLKNGRRIPGEATCPSDERSRLLTLLASSTLHGHDYATRALAFAFASAASHDDVPVPIPPPPPPPPYAVDEDAYKRVIVDFDNVKPDAFRAVQHRLVRAAAKGFAEFLVQNTPQSYQQVIALDRLTEALFWANSAIAHHDLPEAATGCCSLDAPTDPDAE